MRARKIILVDDSSEFRASVRKTLGREFVVVEACSSEGFLREFRPFAFDLVILDMRLEDGREGLGLLRDIRAQDEFQPVIMVSAYGDTDAIIEATEAGALMFLHKRDFTPDLLARMVEAVLQQAQIRRHLTTLENRFRLDDPLSISTGNPSVRRAAQAVARAGDDPECVAVVCGETGAGLDLAAAAIHDRSPRRRSWPFVTGTLELETSELSKVSLLERAQGGVLFLPTFDVTLMAARQRLFSTMNRQASMGDRPVDVQLVLGCQISATDEVVSAVRGAMPTARLVEIILPSLRDRREDIPLLAAYFLQDLRRSGQTTARGVSKEALDALERWGWPGNLHELRAAIGHAAVQAAICAREEIERRHLPANIGEPAAVGMGGNGKLDIRAILARAETRLVADALETAASKTKTQLAERLGYTDRFTIGRRMRKVLHDYPELGKEFPSVKAIFNE